MSEWLKEPVLKTGDVQASVGSNPTLSAMLLQLHMSLQKYPRGRRGSPAKGVGWIKPPRGFKSLLLRHVGASDVSLAPIFYGKEPTAHQAGKSAFLADALRLFTDRALPQAAKNIKGLPMRKNIPKETFQQVKKSHCKAFLPHSSSLFL